MALALVLAVAAHGLLFWWLAGRMKRRSPVALAPAAESAPAVTDLASVALLTDVPAVALVTGELPETIPGSHSRSGNDTRNPHARAERDLPGARPVARGGGAEGGTDAFTGRRDRESFRTQHWNDPAEDRLPRHEQGRDRSATPASPESLARQRERGFDDRTEPRRRAQLGVDTPTPGGVDSPQAGGGGLPAKPPDWRSADPLFSGPVGSAAPRRVDGRTGARGSALTDVGAPATEADVRDRARDRQNVGAASSELDPAPIEMTHTSAGGQTRGVRGKRSGEGDSARGRGSRGTAASTAQAGDADELPSVRARRRDPFFRRMYQRMDELIEFPGDLALALRQGEVVIHFTLSADGHLSELSVTKSSGYAAFDREVISAVRKAAPFGRVPGAVLAGRPAIRVSVPYAFKNPLIR